MEKLQSIQHSSIPEIQSIVETSGHQSKHQFQIPVHQFQRPEHLSRSSNSSSSSVKNKVSLFNPSMSSSSTPASNSESELSDSSIVSSELGSDSPHPVTRSQSQQGQKLVERKSLVKRRIKSTKSDSTNMSSLSLELALKIIPEFDGNSKNLEKFLKNSELAHSKVKDEDKVLLFELIKTKLVGKAYESIRYREIDTFANLKKYLKASCSDSKTTAHLQLELNSCRQKINEEVKIYANRLENILCQLTIASCADKDKPTSKAISELIKTQAKQVFQKGLSGPLKFLIKAKNDATLEECIQSALSEEISMKSDRESRKYFTSSLQNPSTSQVSCKFCNRTGHKPEECYFQHRGTLSQPKVQYTAIICNYCKKRGHYKRLQKTHVQRVSEK